jgi:hypothetical protein
MLKLRRNANVSSPPLPNASSISRLPSAVHRLVLASFLLAGAAWVHWHPSPGAITAATREEVCQPGYARTHRPLYAWTWLVKRLMTVSPAKYALDHVVPLEVGGAPYALSNLQLQPWPEARAKDREENETHRALCAGEISLGEAQGRFMRAAPDTNP